MTGVDFDITPNVAVGIGYKYLAANTTIGDKNSDKVYADADFKASMITAGLTFTF